MARLGWRFVLVLAASTTSLAADAAPQVPVGAPEAPKQCGELSYLPSTYTCFGNTTLCPVSMGIASRPCTASGVNSGCYSPYDYSCDAATGKLKPLPPATSPFTLTSYAKQSWLNGLQVKACGGYLAMGAGAHQCATCRGAPNGTDCSKFGNKPVLLPDGKMAAAVEGGQFWYVSNDEEALMYTKVGANGTELALAGLSVKLYEGGLFQFANAPHYWLACLRTINGGFPGTAKVWRIYASTGGNLERQDCHPIQLVTTPVADRMEGAYRFD